MIAYRKLLRVVLLEPQFQTHKISISKEVNRLIQIKKIILINLVQK